MAVRPLSLGLLCCALAVSGVDGGFAQWMMRAFQGDDRRFVIDGRKLLVDGQPIHLKGVCWSPVPLGGEDPSDLDRDGWVERDSELMKEAGINAVRMYEPLLNTTTLDVLWSKGIYVINMAYVWGGDSLDNVAPRINAVKDHPAILAWEVGNEWNYNYFYYKRGQYDNGDIDTLEQATQRAVDVVSIIKVHDLVHPVVTVYGEVPTQEVYDALSEVDIWALNVYRFNDFGTLFRQWQAMSPKPMYIGEYGADAYDARPEFDGPNLTAQADATRVLTEQITTHTSIHGGTCLGGMIFELADEWWKAGNATQHDIGGVAPGGGPYPDKSFNEEWWGLCEIDRTCRPAFDEYKAIAIPTPPAAPDNFPQQAMWGAIAVLTVVTGICYFNRAPEIEEPSMEMGS